MIKFDSQYHLYDITPIENMFIQQYLVKSPGDYVKVYIYCLNLCYFPNGEANVTYESIALALKLNTEDVQRAMRYWCRLGVMTVESFDENLDIEMHSSKEMLLSNDVADSFNLYQFREFNNALSDVFSPRILDTQDYILYQDMINIFEVSGEYVIEAVKYAVKTSKSVDIPYKYVEKIIEAWKNDNINTVESLKTYLEKRDSTYKELCTILRYLGMNRAPTIPELNCYKKWTEEYKFSFEAIKEACNATISANSPTIKYLDSILMGLYEKKASTPEQIVAVKEKSDNYRMKVRKLLYYFGITGAPSATQVQKYTKWEKDYHFNEDAITIAASMITGSSNHFEALDRLLESFYMNGISDADSMLVYMNKKHENDSNVNSVKAVLKDNGEIKEIERNYIKKWLNDYSMPMDVILFSATLSLSADKPWAYMNKILENWNLSGVRTLEAAQAKANESKNTSNAPQTAQIKKYSFTNIDSHTYTDDDYSSMFDDLSGTDKK